MTSDDPYARLSLRDRLELLAFEGRLAGFPKSLIQDDVGGESMCSTLVSGRLTSNSRDAGPHNGA